MAMIGNFAPKGSPSTAEGETVGRKTRDTHAYDAQSGTITCNTCGETKPLAEFGPCKRNHSGRTHKCKACTNRYYKDRRKSLAPETPTPLHPHKHFEAIDKSKSAQRSCMGRMGGRKATREMLSGHPDGMFRCIKCGAAKPKDSFTPMAGRPFGISYSCRECKAAYSRALYAKARPAARKNARPQQPLGGR
jgi:hypothetical protein